MPTRTGQDSTGCYARWGRHGKKYYYACGDAAARKRAVIRANRQGAAVRASGWTGNAARTATARRSGKLDPSRTYALRRRFVRDMRRRFTALMRAVYDYIVTRDTLGLVEKEKQAARLATHAGYAFATDAQKTAAFRQWLQRQIDADVLSVQGDRAGEPWTAQYVQSAYKQGALRSYKDKYAERAGQRVPGLGATRGEFIESAFFSPEMLSKVELLATRAYESLKGVTATMASEMNRVLATALVEGRGAAKTARMLRDTVGNLTNRRALVLARTEVIYAHAEGQLDGYTQLGVDVVKAEVEWSTANDGAVCEECGSMEGQVYRISEAHGLIPLHPNCRCAWVPVDASAASAASGKYYAPESMSAKELRSEYSRLLDELQATRLRGELGAPEERILAKIRDVKARMLALKSAKAPMKAKAVRPRAVKVTKPTKPTKPLVSPRVTEVKPAPIKPAPTTQTPAGSLAPKRVSAKGTTRFSSAEEYRQEVLRYVDTLDANSRNYVALRLEDSQLRDQILLLENKLHGLRRSSTEYRALVKQLDDLSDRASVTFRALNSSKVNEEDILRQVRGVLAEKHGIRVSATSTVPKDTTSVSDLLSWVPDNSRLSAYERQRMTNVMVRITDEGQSYYQPSRNAITLAAKNDRTLAHEFGHQMSFGIEGFDEAQTAFFEARTAAESVHEIMPGIYGKEDKFSAFAKYAGRVYEDGKAPEIAAIGIEHVWANPILAATKDPEWFDFVISQIKGVPMRAVVE